MTIKSLSNLTGFTHGLDDNFSLSNLKAFEASEGNFPDTYPEFCLLRIVSGRAISEKFGITRL